MKIKTDITIIGAGLVGITASLALAQLGLDVVVIDSADLDIERKKESDGRTCAIAAGSANIFKDIGVWDDLQPHAGKILDIRVTDGNSPIFLHYDHSIVGDQPMGYIIENFHLREALFKRAASFSPSPLSVESCHCEEANVSEPDAAIHSSQLNKIASSHSLRSAHSNDKGNIRIIAPARYSDIKFGDEECTVTLSNGDIITSQLIIAADGKNSNVRKLAGIRTHDWNYNQAGIVCTITHEHHHQYIAQERFLPEGPFAVLPMAGGYHSSLVWTEKSELVPVYMAMEKAEIEEQITLRTGEYLGKINLASRMYSYPLSLCKAKRYTGKRLALIGDAAHAMHPLAGQGFNVGIRDVAELAALIRDEGIRDKGIKENFATSSLHPFIPSSLLKKYEAARMADSISLLGITDILNRTFSNNIIPLRSIRRLGMLAVNQTTPLKKFFMKHAMGVE